MPRAVQCPASVQPTSFRRAELNPCKDLRLRAVPRRKLGLLLRTRRPLAPDFFQEAFLPRFGAQIVWHEHGLRHSADARIPGS